MDGPGPKARHVVIGDVTFTTMDVDTEGRGRKPKSCRGEITGIDTSLDIVAE